MKNPVLEEIYEVREQLLAESGGTLAGLVKRLQKDQESSGREIVNLGGVRIELQHEQAEREQEAAGR
jgi:hypothetical protein